MPRTVDEIINQAEDLAARFEEHEPDVDGVKDATVTYEEGLAHVTYDPAKTNPTAIAAAVEEQTGYKAQTQVSPPSK